MALMDQLLKAQDDVLYECERQIKLWGEQNHGPSVWMNILMEEVGEACQANLAAEFESKDPLQSLAYYDHYRLELVQVAAVALSAIASYDRGKWRQTKTEGSNDGCI
jgi:uncharacterized protein YbdZ (MbtH family)